ncbi:hypothetical protein, partial [Rhizobium leguminosarum]|uniref:hypothetical protein n=1 Tax=Rhizobium leguminosarum TaxID=384 RepID=UPI001954C871
VLVRYGSDGKTAFRERALVEWTYVLGRAWLKPTQIELLVLKAHVCAKIYFDALDGCSKIGALCTGISRSITHDYDGEPTSNEFIKSQVVKVAAIRQIDDSTVFR